MSIEFITFGVSLAGMISIIVLKMSVFKERHFNFWIRIRRFSDDMIHRFGRFVKDRSVQFKHQSLLKIISLFYHSVIPFVERQYRKTASSFYKLHRKLWGFLEYSKSSTKHVSEYLKHLSEHKNKPPL